MKLTPLRYGGSANSQRCGCHRREIHAYPLLLLESEGFCLQGPPALPSTVSGQPAGPRQRRGDDRTHLSPPGIDDSQMVIVMNASFMQLFQSRLSRGCFATIFLHLTIYGPSRVRLVSHVSIRPNPSNGRPQHVRDRIMVTKRVAGYVNGFWEPQIAVARQRASSLAW